MVEEGSKGIPHPQPPGGLLDRTFLPEDLGSGEPGPGLSEALTFTEFSQSLNTIPTGDGI